LSEGAASAANKPAGSACPTAIHVNKECLYLNLLSHADIKDNNNPINLATIKRIVFDMMLRKTRTDFIRTAISRKNASTNKNYSLYKKDCPLRRMWVKKTVFNQYPQSTG